MKKSLKVVYRTTWATDGVRPRTLVVMRANATHDGAQELAPFVGFLRREVFSCRGCDYADVFVGDRKVAHLEGSNQMQGYIPRGTTFSSDEEEKVVEAVVAAYNAAPHGR